MQLELHWPQCAAVSCGDCQAWVYDKDWKRAKRGGHDVPRPPGTPTPCKTCPKKSPEHAKTLVMSTRNRATVQRYYEQLATGGACLTKRERRDRWLLRLFSLIARELKTFERGEQFEMLAKMMGATRR